MKRLFGYLAVIFSSLMMTSCVTAMSAETPDGVVVTSSTSVEYYDYDNLYVVVYFDGIPSYRFWDAHYLRYYYRPVPRERYGFIRHRPLSPALRHYNHRPQPRHHQHGEPAARPNKLNHHGQFNRPTQPKRTHNQGMNDNHGQRSGHFGRRR